MSPSLIVFFMIYIWCNLLVVKFVVVVLFFVFFIPSTFSPLVFICYFVIGVQFCVFLSVSVSHILLCSKLNSFCSSVSLYSLSTTWNTMSSGCFMFEFNLKNTKMVQTKQKNFLFVCFTCAPNIYVDDDLLIQDE